jgi:glycosyltransferase involved in cell wall biosynthesis
MNSTSEQLMNLSVILPTYNRLDRLKIVLAGLNMQDYPKDLFEVLVISDGSTDGTQEYLHALSTPYCLRPFFQSNQGPAAARNLGIMQASGAYVLFLDDDVVPTPGLIVEHMRIQSASASPTAVFGPMLSPQDFRLAPWVAWEQALLVRQYTAIQSGRWEPNARMFYTGNASLPRQIVVDAGGFDPSFRRAEDVELGYRLAEIGVRFHFAPLATGYHYADRSYQSWLNGAYAYGCNDVVIGYAKEQSWLISTLLREFWQRNVLVRFLVNTCVNHPRRYNRSIAGLRTLAGAAWRMRLVRVAHMAYSGVFNLAYYQGMADELTRRDMNIWDELNKNR